ncbi:MAG: PKD domain-containing protein, partial [Candidatus Aminicenantes bacterium]
MTQHKKFVFRLFFLFITLLLGFGGALINSDELKSADHHQWSGMSQGPKYLADQIIIDAENYAVVERIARENDLKVLRKFKAVSQKRGRWVGVLKMKKTARVSVETVVDTLRATSGVISADFDHLCEAVVMPNDPKFSQLYGLHNTGQSGGTADADIDAPEAWDITTGSSNVIIAVVDTGINYTHEDLVDNMWMNPGEVAGNSQDDDGNGYVDDIYGIDAYNNDSNPKDDHGHGSHVSGTIGAKGNNNKGVVGVNWNVKLMALKFLGSGGTGPESAAITCYEYLIEMKRRGQNIVAANNSWVTSGFNQTLRDVIVTAGQEGVLSVAAAGNNGQNSDYYPQYPGAFSTDYVINVANTTRNDGLNSGSNYGVTSVDLGAPGTYIESCYHSSNNSYAQMTGTSMASPHVAGVVGLLAAVLPDETPLQRRERILSTVDPLSSLSGKCVTGGRLNAFSAVNAQPYVTADFSWTNDGMYTRIFSDESTAHNCTITSWDWNFGDGNTSTQQNPTHTYSSSAWYDVSLTVNSDTGASDTITKQVWVGANQPPVAEANGPYSGYVNSAISFSSEGSNDPDGTIAGFLWDFGDGNTSTAANPDHTYTAGGTYTVTLTVTDNDGAQDSDTTSAEVILIVGNTQVFSSNTTAANRRAAPYIMPENGTIQSISMYHSGGSGQMILAVYDGTSTDPANRLGLTAATTVSGGTGWQTINLQDPVFVSGNSQIWLAWVYENNPGIAYESGTPGRVDAGVGWSGGMPDPFGSSTQANYIYSIYATYTTGPGPIQYTLTTNTVGQGSITLDPPGGTYNEGTVVTLTAVPDAGWQFDGWSGDLSGSDNPATITMNSDKNVTATFTETGIPDTVGNTVVFSSSTTAANRRAMPFTMPENGTINSVTMYHTGGSGDMILGVYDGEGTPQNRLGVTAATPVSGSTGWQTINLTGSAYVSGGSTVWLAWVYENNPGIAYEDGSPGRVDAGVGWSGGMPDPFGSASQANYIYSIYATYTPGGTNTPPTADFSFTTSELTANFTDQSSDPDGTIQSWEWDFGDGGTSTTQNPSHTYSSAGTYTVTLTVTDNGDATDWVSKDVTVSAGNQSPTADFTFTTNELTANFTDQSSDPDGTIESWNWDFGDGGTSTTQNPSHTYAADGTYTVYLTVTDNDGATDNTSKDVTVSSGGGIPTYCPSSSLSTMTMYITEVEVGSFSNSSGSSTYTDFTNLTVNLNKGGNYSISLTPYNSFYLYYCYWRIWIDYNRDGDFNDAGELVFQDYGQGSQPITGSFTVPSSGVVTGQKVGMRVSLKQSGYRNACSVMD